MVAVYPIDPRDSAEVLAAAGKMFAAAKARGVRVTEEQFCASLRGLPPEDVARIASGYAATLDDWVAMGLDPNEDPLDGDAVPIDQAVDDGSLGISRQDWERLCASSS